MITNVWGFRTNQNFKGELCGIEVQPQATWCDFFGREEEFILFENFCRHMTFQEIGVLGRGIKRQRRDCARWILLFERKEYFNFPKRKVSKEIF